MYGNFPKTLWNGGRGKEHMTLEYSEIERYIDLYNSNDIHLRFIFTNQLLTEEHLSDEYCNRICEIANNGLNSIVIYSDLLEEYLRDKYKNFKFISSTTKYLTSKEDTLSELEKDYELVCLYYEHNKDTDFLRSIKNKHKVEFLANQYCTDFCPHKRLHYKVVSQENLGLKTDDFKCIGIRAHFNEAKEGKFFLSNEDLQYYDSLGFHHFKLEGRCSYFETIIDSYLYYMVKPEYWDSVKNFLYGKMSTDPHGLLLERDI